MPLTRVSAAMNPTLKPAGWVGHGKNHLQHGLSRSNLFPLNRQRKQPWTDTHITTNVAEVTADSSLDVGDVSGDEAAPAVEFARQQPMNWSAAWYPVAAILSLDTTKINPIKLLGRDLVLWHHPDGSWRCFEDRCPHRAAPLSEGKLWKDEGVIMCSYHGWRFDSEGNCRRVPQAASPEAEQRACSNKRACATTFTVKEAQGLLFVWGEPGEKGAQAAEKTSIINNDKRREDFIRSRLSD